MLELAISETVRMQSIATCFEMVDEIVPTAAWRSLSHPQTGTARWGNKWGAGSGVGGRVGCKKATDNGVPRHLCKFSNECPFSQTCCIWQHAALIQHQCRTSMQPKQIQNFYWITAAFYRMQHADRILEDAAFVNKDPHGQVFLIVLDWRKSYSTATCYVCGYKWQIRL